MAFSIAFQHEPLCYPYDDPATPAACGLLVLGDWKEEFLASLYQWSKEDYERQWRHAINVLIQRTRKSALITEYVSPEAASHLVWWPMYLVGETVLFQNHLLFYDQLERPFVIQDALSFVRDRQTVNEEGRKISEWAVSLDDVEVFARRCNSQRLAGTNKVIPNSNSHA
jgi:hypothetical protein